jgi:hypothetical protein
MLGRYNGAHIIHHCQRLHIRIKLDSAITGEQLVIDSEESNNVQKYSLSKHINDSDKTKICE